MKERQEYIRLRTTRVANLLLQEINGSIQSCYPVTWQTHLVAGADVLHDLLAEVLGLAVGARQALASGVAFVQGQLLRLPVYSA